MGLKAQRRIAYDYYRSKDLSHEDSEDLAQDALVELIQAKPENQNTRSFLLLVCSRNFLDFQEKRLRRQKLAPTKSFTDLQLDAGLIPEEDDAVRSYRVEGILFGSGSWTPAREGDWTDGEGLYNAGNNPKRCDICGGDQGPVREGSNLYCAGCHRSGVDGLIYRELGIRK